MAINTVQGVNIYYCYYMGKKKPSGKINPATHSDWAILRNTIIIRIPQVWMSIYGSNGWVGLES